MIQPWQIQRSEHLLDGRVFKVRKDVAVNPRTGRAMTIKASVVPVFRVGKRLKDLVNRR